MTLTIFDASQYQVRSVPLAEARAFIQRYHYAGGCANTAVFAHGLYRSPLGDCELLGVALWMPPTKVCAQSVAGDAWRGVLALSRLAVHPVVPTNGASFLIGRSVRLIRRDARWVALVTFADESQGHTGGIYRATNWSYVGRTKPEARWVDAEGKQVSRLATKSRTKADMLALGHRLDGKHCKHKFTMRLR